MFVENYFYANLRLFYVEQGYLGTYPFSLFHPTFGSNYVAVGSGEVVRLGSIQQQQQQCPAYLNVISKQIASLPTIWPIRLM